VQAGHEVGVGAIASSTAEPIRVMIFMDATTYAESVSSTPNIGFSASIGPMQNGRTYIVRPRMQPRYSSVITAFISAGSIQLFVGPASCSRTEQMKVRSSTRATSDGVGARVERVRLLVLGQAHERARRPRARR
jgi:hypothetical protein